MDRPARILVVEDNQDTLELVEFVLAKAGHEVFLAPDGATARSSLRETRPDLVLMDLQLPDVSGLDLTREIRADPSLNGVVILAFTAFAMEADRQRAMEAGCDGYITKPVSIHTLLETVEEHTRGS